MPRRKNLSVADVERGNRILEARKRLRFTQKEVADRCGVYVMTVSGWEHGTSRPERKLMALSRALQTDPSWLDGGYDTESEVNRFFSLPHKHHDSLLCLLVAIKLARITQEQTKAGQFILKKDAKALADRWFSKHGLPLKFIPPPAYLKASEKARIEGTYSLSDLGEE